MVPWVGFRVRVRVGGPQGYLWWGGCGLVPAVLGTHGLG